MSTMILVALRAIKSAVRCNAVNVVGYDTACSLLAAGLIDTDGSVDGWTLTAAGEAAVS